jgi:hypothetical protein
MRNVDFFRRACLWVFGTAVFVGVSLVAVSSESAPTPPVDHLKCYQVTQDTNPREKATVNLNNAQFGLEEGCTLITKAPLFCAPTQKFIDPPSTEQGPILTSDYLCYKVKCPTRDKKNILVDDQFGTRQITVEDARLLCTPTVKSTTPPCGGTAPQCFGLCDPGLQCKSTNVPGTHPTCECR